MKRVDDDRGRETKPEASEGPRTKRQKVDEQNDTSKGVGCADASLSTGSSGSMARVSKRESRVRLPDKILKYLNDEPMPEVIWWMPDGNGFAYNVETVQEKFLDKCFGGTKLTSFVRSLNRW